ncbi:unnamed protein product [Soboliphyme baturini]|uniref:Uncharacterized protein n=1 Tax=Soboliphyme baturini TaxID=241478 RepID=A0A3P7YIJ6_9BILA|nr:unnamed protein product [Soboliphyme baturini]
MLNEPLPLVAYSRVVGDCCCCCCCLRDDNEENASAPLVPRPNVLPTPATVPDNVKPFCSCGSNGGKNDDDDDDEEEVDDADVDEEVDDEAFGSGIGTAGDRQRDLDCSCNGCGGVCL